MIGNLALRQEHEIQNAGKAFARQYGLAETVGVHIARTLDSWEALGEKRARTEADLADFTKRLYGVDSDQARDVLTRAQAGDMTGLEQSVGQVADYWGTNPETAKTILKSWFSDQLSEYNAQ